MRLESHASMDGMAVQLFHAGQNVTRLLLWVVGHRRERFGLAHFGTFWHPLELLGGLPRLLDREGGFAVASHCLLLLLPGSGWK